MGVRVLPHGRLLLLHLAMAVCVVIHASFRHGATHVLPLDRASIKEEIVLFESDACSRLSCLHSLLYEFDIYAGHDLDWQLVCRFNLELCVHTTNLRALHLAEKDMLLY